MHLKNTVQQTHLKGAEVAGPLPRAASKLTFSFQYKQQMIYYGLEIKLLFQLVRLKKKSFWNTTKGKGMGVGGNKGEGNSIKIEKRS